MNLVFVHFGTIPKHLKSNISDTCKRFPNLNVYVITDCNANCFVDYENLHIVTKDISSRVSDFRRISTLPVGFRNGFWLLSLIRLEVFGEFVNQLMEPSVHLESDVVISSDFPFDFLRNSKRSLAYVRVSENESIASVLFLNPGETCSLFVKSIFSDFQKNPGMTDMKFLSDFQKCYPDMVFELPADANDPNDSEFLFDGSDFGQYLLGTDPRNSRGVRYLNFNNRNTRVITNSYTFQYNSSREFMDASLGEKSFKLSNLHVHSKRLRMFRPSTRTKILKGSITPFRRKWRFHLLVFIRQLKSSLKRRLSRHA